MPYPNEHSARLQDPDNYNEFRRENDELGDGIDAIYGITRDGAELQSIRFDAEEFTVSEAKEWLEEHDYEPDEFESASGDSEQSVPATALTFVAHEFSVGEVEEGTEKYPVRLKARTDKVVEHFYWGRAVHDLEGMQLKGKDRIPIDWVHSDDVLGYLDTFEVEDGALWASGYLVPYGDSDKVSEIMHKAENGVPYEASINFGGNGISVEYVRETDTTQVNGNEVEGPATVFREWPLRGVAICPYGADEYTRAEFDDENRQVTVHEMSTATFNEEEEQMADEVNDTPETEDSELSDETEQEELTQDEPEEELNEDELENEEPVEESDSDTELEQERDLDEFMNKFGDAKGARFYRDELSYVEALEKDHSELQDKVEELEQRIEQAELGADEEDAPDFDDSESDQGEEWRVKGFSEGEAAYLSSVEFAE